MDRIWLDAAAALGLVVRRGRQGYATTDGQGTLTLAEKEDLDPDDCLAQMILHELCHFLVQGHDSLAQPDWGLGNDEHDAQYGGDIVREHACLVVQAALTAPHGLRLLLAPTTDHRAYYDALPQDPLSADGEGDERGASAVALARDGLGRARRAPFCRVLDDALRRSAAIHRLMGARDKGAESPKKPAGVPSLWEVAPAPPLHPAGWPLEDGLTGPVSGTCGGCAWRYEAQGVSRCRRTERPDRPDGGRAGAGARVELEWPACVLYEAALDCRTCAACCREGYDLVLVGRREPAALLHPALIEQAGGALQVRRQAGGRRCGALCGGTGGEAYGCTIYEDRPRACRDLLLGGAHCLAARRRTGLSL